MKYVNLAEIEQPCQNLRVLPLQFLHWGFSNTDTSNNLQVEELILIQRQTMLAVKCKGKSLILPFGYGKNTFTISKPTNYAKISLDTITWLSIW